MDLLIVTTQTAKDPIPAREAQTMWIDYICTGPRT